MPDRRPILVFSNKVEDHELRRRRGDYVEDPKAAPTAWVEETLAKSYGRAMFLQPTGRAGNLTNDPVASFAALSAIEKQGWIFGLDRARNEGLQISIYTGLYQSAGGPTTVDSAPDGATVLRSQNYFDAAMRPWLELGASMIMYDTLGAAYATEPWIHGWLERQHERASLKVKWPRALIGHEAVATEKAGVDPNGRAVYDLSQVHTPKGPGMVMATTMRDVVDPNERLYCHPDWEVHVWLADAGNGWDRAELLRLVKSWIARGFVVSGECSTDPEVHRLIMAQGGVIQ